MPTWYSLFLLALSLTAEAQLLPPGDPKIIELMREASAALELSKELRSK